jgi:membrane protease YdiL (CAAX protease family)
VNRFSLSWNPEYRSAVVALATFTGAYFLYWFIANSVALRSFCDKRRQGERSQAMYILLQRGVGVLFLGIPAAAAAILLPQIRFSDLGLTAVDSVATLYWILGISAVVIPLVFGFSRRPSFFEIYPLIRKRIWDATLIAVNTLSWGVYILIYEFLFRGFLLMSCIRAFGVWPGILVNVALYVCVHIPYGFWVTLGALLLGIAMCVATAHTGNIWTAYAVHLFVALLNDYVALAANPETRVHLGGPSV